MDRSAFKGKLSNLQVVGHKLAETYLLRAGPGVRASATAFLGTAAASAGAGS